MHRWAALPAAAAIALSAAALTHVEGGHSSSLRAAASQATVKVIRATCFEGQKSLTLGESYDHHRCDSLRWRIEGHPAATARNIEVLWSGSCLDGNPELEQRQVGSVLGIAVTARAKTNAPVTGCPALGGVLDVRLSQGYGHIRLVHGATN